MSEGTAVDGMAETDYPDRKKAEEYPSVRYVYKEADGLKLDLLCCFPETEHPAGCAFFIHGGGWRGDVPERLKPHAGYAAIRGLVGVSISYRLLDEQRKTDVRDGLEDCLDALTFVRERLKEKYGEDLPIAAIGDSAGGYYAVCLGCRSISEHVRPGFRLAEFVVDLNGIVDLTGKWAYGILRKNAGERQTEICRRYSPLFNVSPDDSPALILHGDRDKTVALSDAVAYARSLTEAGVKNELHILEGAAHAFILFDYHHDNGYVARILQKVIDVLCARFSGNGKEEEDI